MNVRSCLAGMLLVGGVVGAARAIPVTGTSVFLTGTTVDQRPELAGDVIASQDITVQRDTNGPNVGYRDVILHNYVVRESATGTLDFYYQLTSTSTQQQQIFQMAITGFDVSAPLDMDELAVPGDLDFAFFANANSFPSATNGTITFGSAARGTGSFFLDAGQSTRPMFIRTSATAYDTSGTFTFIPNTLPEGTFAPLSSPVPEPAALALLPMAVGALGIRFRRR